MRITTPADVGALVRTRREALSWSQQNLADRCGVSKRWLVALEAGKPGAQLGLVLRTLTTLGLRLDAVHAPDDSGVELDALLDQLDADGR